ncbi:hypothetical protein [Dickeya solani]|uniref:SH3 domain-containing protein n=2 Tax=Dickeya solani TaxID=1089444 RepID=A0AAV3KEY8_9GAMM|nr:hypothetical protein [Dickeya solani]ANE75592.1 hypothetical protein A4U42_09705 [Dickeya solani IPO 2222]AUC43045.1 hypothetical protein D083_2696 [Dickeya solani RNS 08.23.3.1.A]AUH08994.1 hypothetical protein BJD21_11330 [Dickeya solani D s0432-1]AUH12975.1 hypothetical protein BJJ98_11295 [Dickeya solani]AYQ50163.1 hypothetical protein DSOL99_00121 [Dickeya solani]
MKMKAACLLCSLINNSAIADESNINYGYDKNKGEIYAVSEKGKGVLNFEENYTGNPAVSFGFFNNKPSIIVSARSLHDYTAYMTLQFKNGNFYADCLYVDIKSKQNGVASKEGLCGLNTPVSDDYMDLVEKQINDVSNNIDTVDTSYFLNGKTTYIPLILFRGKDSLIYKIYKNKSAMLNDEYQILLTDKHGQCQSYNKNTWLEYNSKAADNAHIKAEKNKDDQISLIPIVVENGKKSNDCEKYSTFKVKSDKSFFYDENKNPKNSYLIKGDNITLLSIQDDDKWCRVRYVSDKNKNTDGNMLCSELTL